MLPRIQPIAPKRIQAPFDHTEFVFELKMDGWRCLAYIENGVCRLVSRKQNQFKSFSPLAASVAKLKVQNAIIDGEVACLDAKGKSVFLDMRRRKANAILYCFDLLWLNNEDLRNLSLVERKARLRQLIRRAETGACFMRAIWRVKASGCLRRYANRTVKESSANTKEAPTRLSLSHG